MNVIKQIVAFVVFVQAELTTCRGPTSLPQVPESARKPLQCCIPYSRSGLGLSNVVFDSTEAMFEKSFFM